MEYGIKNIFRFYDALEKQNKNYAYVHGNVRTFQLLTDIYHVPTFQIKVASAVVDAGDIDIKLVDLVDDSEVDIDAYFTFGTDLYIETFTDYNYLIYNRSKNLNTLLDKGTYYLKITLNAGSPTYPEVLYSEVFCVKDITGCTIITYYSDMDIDGIDYTNGAKTQFQNKLIIPNKLFKPDYVEEAEGTEDGEGNFLATFKSTVKNYKLLFYAPEYIVDAFSLIPLHEHITVVADNGESSTETLTVVEDSFEMTGVEWTDGKAFAKITCEFRTGRVIKTNFADNIT